MNYFTCLVFSVQGPSIPSHFLSNCWSVVTADRQIPKWEWGSLRTGPPGDKKADGLTLYRPLSCMFVFFYNEHFVHFGCVCGGGGRCVLRREKDQMKEETNKTQTQKYKEMSFKSRTKYYTICAVNFGRVHGGSCLNFSNVLS